jgi:hypothetical protein
MGTSAMWASDGATVRLVGCSFTGNTPDTAVLLALAVAPEEPDAQDQDTIVRLLQPTFTDNVAEQQLITFQGKYLIFTFSEFAARIYSDVTHEVIHITDGKNKSEGFTEPLSAAPAARQGITGSSDWLQMTRKVRSTSFLAHDASSVMAWHRPALLMGVQHPSYDILQHVVSKYW